MWDFFVVLKHNKLNRHDGIQCERLLCVRETEALKFSTSIRCDVSDYNEMLCVPFTPKKERAEWEYTSNNTQTCTTRTSIVNMVFASSIPCACVCESIFCIGMPVDVLYMCIYCVYSTCWDTDVSQRAFKIHTFIRSLTPLDTVHCSALLWQVYACKNSNILFLTVYYWNRCLAQTN